MPTGNKIALFGMGRIGRVLFAGTAALNLAGSKKEESIFDSDILLKLIEPADYSILVKEYRKVQRKYYPEQDVYSKVIK